MKDQILIGNLARRLGINAKTIRYYEDVGVLPPAKRLPNGYRVYGAEDEERLRFVRGARSLGLSLEDITEILAFRDRGEAPCRYVFHLLQTKTQEVDARIAELKRLRHDLRYLNEAASCLPQDDIEMKKCVCHLVQEHAGPFRDFILER